MLDIHVCATGSHLVNYGLVDATSRVIVETCYHVQVSLMVGHMVVIETPQRRIVVHVVRRLCRVICDSFINVGHCLRWLVRQVVLGGRVLVRTRAEQPRFSTAWLHCAHISWNNTCPDRTLVVIGLYQVVCAAFSNVYLAASLLPIIQRMRSSNECLNRSKA